MEVEPVLRSTGTIVVTAVWGLSILPLEAAAQGGPEARVAIALSDVTVVDLVTGELLQQMTVLIRGNRIASVGPASRPPEVDSVIQIDASGKFLIPGLWDMHVHLFSNVDRPGTDNADRYFPMFIANGVTGVRDMWTDLEDLQVVRRWREETASGMLIGPRIVATSTILDGPDPSYENSLAIGTAQEARRVVDSLVASGAEFIKVYERLPQDVYFAIAERSRDLATPFGGHLPLGVDAANASDAGQKSMEHLLQMREMCLPDRGQFVAEYRRRASSDFPEVSSSAGQWAQDELRKSYASEYCAGVLQRLRENQTWQVPTLVLTRARDVLLRDSSVLNDPRLRFVPNATRRSWARETGGGPAGWQLFRTYSRLVPVLHAHGVPILVGTDIGSWYLYAGFSVHDEMELLVDEGKLSPLASLQAATLNAARYLNALDSLGTINEGKIADLVVLDANPLEDISNTQRIHAVVLDGRYFNRTALDSMLVTAEELARGERKPAPQ
jgi:hypothetical protein